MNKESKNKYGTIVISCDCKSESQDKLYGKQRRVANLCKKGEMARCTVCGKEIKV